MYLMQQVLRNNLLDPLWSTDYKRTAAFADLLPRSHLLMLHGLVRVGPTSYQDRLVWIGTSCQMFV